MAVGAYFILTDAAGEPVEDPGDDERKILRRLRGGELKLRQFSAITVSNAKINAAHRSRRFRGLSITLEAS